MRDVPADLQRFRSTVEGQWGVVTLDQLRRLGWGEGSVRHALLRGRLIRLHRGVYAVGHEQLRREGRWLAAVLACGAGALLSYTAAAAHHGLRRAAAGLVDVTVPHARRAQSGIRLHRPRTLEPADVGVLDRIPITSPTRTVIDLARVLPMPALERVVAEAEHRLLLDHRRLARARSAKLRAIFGTGSPPRARSRDERRLIKAVRAAGLPEPEGNAWLTHGAGEEWQPDLLFRRERVIVEVDDDRHRTRHAFELDRRKDAVRQADGYRTLRFTRRQLAEDLPAAVGLLARTLATANALRFR